MECLKLLLIFAVTGYCMTAPNIVDPRIRNYGASVYPSGQRNSVVLRSPHIPYHSFKFHYPPIGYDYSGFQRRKYPQAPSFPVYPKQNNYPRFGNNYPINILPPTTIEQDDMNRGFVKPKTTPEQDDMNGGFVQSRTTLEQDDMNRWPDQSADEDIIDSESEEDYSDNVIPNPN